MKKTISRVGRIFAFVGTVLLAVGGWYAWNTQRFLATAVHADGVVVDMVRGGGRRSYRPVVGFTAADGQRIRFTSMISSQPPQYDLGERVGVYYSPDEPEEARIDGRLELWLVALILAPLGLLFAAIGLGIVAVTRRNARLAQELRRSGRPLQAAFDRVEVDRTVRVNNRYGWRIHARWTDPSGKQHHFRSERLWVDPTPGLRETITVFVDPANVARYHVDVSFLPEMAAGM